MMKNDNDMGNLHEMPSRKGVKRKLSDKNNDSQQGSDIPICNVKKGSSFNPCNVRVANWRKTFPEAKKTALKLK